MAGNGGTIEKEAEEIARTATIRAQRMQDDTAKKEEHAGCTKRWRRSTTGRNTGRNSQGGMDAGGSNKARSQKNKDTTGAI